MLGTTQYVLAKVISFLLSAPQLPVDKETQRQLLSSLKKISHLTDLLHESEANSIRLSDQTKLLKEEIRRCVSMLVFGGWCLITCLFFRLERNQERQKEAAANMEYLKNVVLKVAIIIYVQLLQ